MEFELEAKVVLALNHRRGEDTSQHVSTDYNLIVKEVSLKSQFLTREGLPTKEGVNAVTQCFVQGLVANMHYADKMGYRKEADHLRYIIAELENGFMHSKEYCESKFRE